MKKEIIRLYDEPLNLMEKIEYAFMYYVPPVGLMESLANGFPKCSYCKSRRVKPFKRVTKDEFEKVPEDARNLEIRVKEWYLFQECKKCSNKELFGGLFKNTLHPFTYLP